MAVAGLWRNSGLWSMAIHGAFACVVHFIPVLVQNDEEGNKAVRQRHGHWALSTRRPWATQDGVGRDLSTRHRLIGGLLDKEHKVGQSGLPRAERV